MYRKRSENKKTKKCPLVIREHFWIEVTIVGSYVVEIVGFVVELVER